MWIDTVLTQGAVQVSTANAPEVESRYVHLTAQANVPDDLTRTLQSLQNFTESHSPISELKYDMSYQSPHNFQTARLF